MTTPSRPGYEGSTRGPERRAFFDITRRISDIIRRVSNVEDDSHTHPGNRLLIGDELRLRGDDLVRNADIVLHPGASKDAQIWFLDADGKTKWIVRSRQTAEPSFEILRYHPSGSLRDNPFAIDGSTGDVYIETPNGQTNLSQPPYAELICPQQVWAVGDHVLSPWSFQTNRGGFSVSEGDAFESRIEVPEAGIYVGHILLTGIGGEGTIVPSDVSLSFSGTTNMTLPGNLQQGFEPATGLSVGISFMFRSNVNGSFQIFKRRSGYTRRHLLTLAKVANY